MQNQQEESAVSEVKQKKESLLKRVGVFMGEKKPLLSWSLVFSALSTLLGFLPFIAIWLIAREIINNPASVDSSNIFFYAILILISIAASVILYTMALSFSHLAAFRVEVAMRKIGMQRVLKMPLGFFDKHSSGKIRKTIDDSASSTHSFIAHQLPDMAASMVMPIVVLISIFAIDWRFGLLTLVPVVLGFISMSSMMTKEGMEMRKKYLTYLDEMSSESVEYVRGIPVVKTFGQSVFSFKRFTDSIFKYRDFVYKYTVTTSNSMSFFETIMQSLAFFLVPMAIYLLTPENMALVFTNMIFYLILAPNFSGIFMRSAYFQNYVSVTEQVLDKYDALLSYDEMDFKQEDAKKPQNSTIEFKNVVFAYEDATQNAVDDVSFKVNVGETYALVGASGSGKTTIARLAARFWDAKGGDIFIGEVNIKDIAKTELMENISFVFQNTKLFKTSLKENIVYGKENVSDAQIQSAIELSQSSDIIAKLPQGLETVIGGKGTYLSGGEQQRIALARGILKDSPIVILDEATAFADPENEHLIQAGLKALSKGKTTLMIAHRLTSVVNADKILVLDGGKIVESGTHQELLQKDGIYTKMWNEYQTSIKWKI